MKKNTQITYQCEICDSSFDSPTKAKKCEEQHLKLLEESKTHCLVACNREKFPTNIHLEDINDNGLMKQSNILALITYKMLEIFGIDSVVFTKLKNDEYSIDFTELGTYEKWQELIS